MKRSIRPAMRAAAAVVDAMRVKLSPQPLPLSSIRALLALDDATSYDDSELLSALLYLEARDEVVRINGRGWRINQPVTRKPGQDRPPLLFGGCETYTRDGRVQ